MDIDKVKEDFTLKTNDLAEAHGVSAGCITNWTKEGAFPYARRVGKTSTIFYPPRTLRMTGGEIKINIAHRKYIHPIIINDDKPMPIGITQQKSDFIESRLLRIITLIDGLDRKLTRVETKLHAVAEGREIGGAEHHEEPGRNTIGGMIKRSLT